MQREDYKTEIYQDECLRLQEGARMKERRNEGREGGKKEGKLVGRLAGLWKHPRLPRSLEPAMESCVSQEQVCF